jgi:hypothetical protein
MQDNLIIDVGMHNGDDAAFYMHKGFRVVSIEANPTLCQKARARFADQIKSGQLTILPFGDAIMDYMLNFRDCRDRALFTESWYDIHATLDEPKLPEGFPYPVRRVPPKRPLVRRVLGRAKRLIFPPPSN